MLPIHLAESQHSEAPQIETTQSELQKTIRKKIYRMLQISYFAIMNHILPAISSFHIEQLEWRTENIRRN